MAGKCCRGRSIPRRIGVGVGGDAAANASGHSDAYYARFMLRFPMWCRWHPRPSMRCCICGPAWDTTRARAICKRALTCGRATRRSVSASASSHDGTARHWTLHRRGDPGLSGGQRQPILDGNAKRVLARVLASPEIPRQNRSWKRCGRRPMRVRLLKPSPRTRKPS